nr:DUF4157 domain-containing protein [Streptomyces pini]
MIARRTRATPVPEEQPDTGVHEVLGSAGKPLAAPVRRDMEARFGTDFSDVRLHTGATAARSARAIGARAYTSGSHVVIGDGGGDQHTLAHELTHVVQQRQGPVSGTDHGDGLRVSDPSDRFEREAEATAARVLRGPAPLQQRSSTPAASTPGTARTGSVQRTEASAPAPAAQQKPSMAIHQPAYASGDQFAVAATLMNDSKAQVYITCAAGEEKAADAIKGFYVQSGIGEDRIHRIPVGESESRTTAAKKAAGMKVVGVGDATTYVGENFHGDMRKKIRAGWGLDAGEPTGDPDPVEVWLRKEGVDAKGKKIAVLWSRFSGKKGEVHIEHDSGYIGMAQIIAGLGSIDLVLIVGDSAPRKKQRMEGKGEEDTKYGSIAKSFTPKEKESDGYDEQMRNFNAKVVDLTEFWSRPDFQSIVGGTRNHQFQVFDYLDRHATTRHLGFRSGNLEAMALMGFTVKYMEEPDSVIGGSRMEAWHAVDGTDRTAGGGMAPGYERLRVSAPPTRSGKHQKSLTLDEQSGDQKHADWHRAEKGTYEHLKREGRSPDGGSLPKGFAGEDLANIDAYLLTGRSEEGLAPDLIDAVKGISGEYEDAEKQLNRAKSEADKARAASRKVSADPNKKQSVRDSFERKAEESERKLETVRRASERTMEDAAKRFRELCAQYGPLDALRARNLFASNIAHRLTPDAPA